MAKRLLGTVLQSTGAQAARELATLQTLWSGYGHIVRYAVEGCSYPSVVVKHVNLAGGNSHPRGWNTDISHQRKLRSYQVETKWYQDYASRCLSDCRVPGCLAVDSREGEVIMVLEDLDASGFDQRRSSVTSTEAKACIAWLANFHATFLGVSPNGLWPTGTYWHLATRPDELAALDEEELKSAASAIDERLNNCTFKTLVHGDAKLANFCFAEGGAVAAVDFQYVGGGCGMKDLAYFVGSCFDEDECEQREDELLDHYFDQLRQALYTKTEAVDTSALEREWRTLYHFAWADFHRFLKGWSPGHWKINDYSERVCRNIVQQVMHET